MTTREKTSPVALVEAIRASLPVGQEWDERETALLDLAARQAADIELLEADIADEGVRVDGKFNQAIAEVRQSRVALARIVGQVDIPESLSSRSLHGRKAAEARWGGN